MLVKEERQFQCTQSVSLAFRMLYAACKEASYQFGTPFEIGYFTYNSVLTGKRKGLSFVGTVTTKKLEQFVFLATCRMVSFVNPDTKYNRWQPISVDFTIASQPDSFPYTRWIFDCKEAPDEKECWVFFDLSLRQRQNNIRWMPLTRVPWKEGLTTLLIFSQDHKLLIEKRISGTIIGYSSFRSIVMSLLVEKRLFSGSEMHTPWFDNMEIQFVEEDCRLHIQLAEQLF